MKYKIHNSASEIIMFIEKKNTKIQIIFDAENSQFEYQIDKIQLFP